MIVFLILFFVLLALVFAPETAGKDDVVVSYSNQYLTPYKSVLGLWEGIIRDTALKYGINPDQFLKIAKCESGLKPTAKNPLSSAYGIFQFIDSTWNSQLKKYGLECNRDDMVCQIDLAGRMIRDGGLSHWDPSAGCSR